MINAIMNLKS